MTRTTHTHTYAVLAVPQEIYDFIYHQLKEADYQHAFHDNADGVPVIDMHGLALAADPLMTMKGSGFAGELPVLRPAEPELVDARDCPVNRCRAHCPTNEKVLEKIRGAQAGTRVQVDASRAGFHWDQEVYLYEDYVGDSMVCLQHGKNPPRPTESLDPNRSLVGRGLIECIQIYKEPK